MIVILFLIAAVGALAYHGYAAGYFTHEGSVTGTFYVDNAPAGSETHVELVPEGYQSESDVIGLDIKTPGRFDFGKVPSGKYNAYVYALGFKHWPQAYEPITVAPGRSVKLRFDVSKVQMDKILSQEMAAARKSKRVRRFG